MSAMRFRERERAEGYAAVRLMERMTPHYAGREPEGTVATHRGLGDLWADKCSAGGLSIADAWEDYEYC